MSENTQPRPLAGKAVVYAGSGGHEVMRIVQREVRPPAAGEVRIAVRAAAVNPTDILLRERGYPDQPPLVVPGMDAAGIVESVGTGVTRFQPGDEVMAVVLPRRPDGGAQAQHIVVPAACVTRMPAGTTFAQAATLPMNGLTALRALDLARLEKDGVLAVSGGAGLLASYSIAAAKRQGLTVVADAKPQDATFVRSCGADVVVERGASYAAAVRREMATGVDALLDTALLGKKSFGAIRDEGIYIPVRGWSDQPAERGIEIRPVFVFEVLDRTDWLDSLRDMVESSEITLRVADEYAPEQVADAHRALGSGGLRGRPVLRF